MIRRRTFRIIVLMILVLGVLYFIGPKPAPINFTTTTTPAPTDLEILDRYIHDNEASNPHIKPNNEARILWHGGDENKKKTKYVLLYLPGFSGSYFEAEPLHHELGNRYGMNVYLARLQAHGMDKKEALLEFDPDKYLRSAREALQVAKNIGDKVIIMSTSTGGTLALLLAAENPDIYALINYSPNIALADPRAFLLSSHWGLQIARMVEGSDYYIWDAGPLGERYWNEKYRLEALVKLEMMLEKTMTPATFTKIHQPMMVGTWYKNEKNQDHTVSVQHIREMYDQVGTPSNQKKLIEYPNANTHIIACGARSGSYQKVVDDTHLFLEQILKLRPIN